MKAGLVIDIIEGIRTTAAEKQLFQLFLRLKDINNEIKKTYSLNDEVDVNHFTIMLQKYTETLPDDQKVFIKPIIRELKLNQLL